METTRRKIRVNHLTLAILVKRMRAGQFTPRQLTEASGLTRASVLELLDTFEHQGLITFIGKTPMPGPTGRREKLFKEVR